MTENKNLENIQSYPVLTSEVSTLPTRRVGAPGVSLRQTVQQALYETLGWRPRISDPKGFVAALTQSFTSVEVEGRKEWEWTPHVYTIQADLGAVTGAQASIYKRAKVFLDQSLPLLEGLKPLRADYDEEDTEASRAVVESYLTELVDELGLVGGPRVQLVDTRFLTLLGDIVVTTTNPEEVKGQLGVLRDRFGLKRDLVNTIEEEQNLTNYLILVDYVLSLKRSWDAQRHFFDRRGTDVYLGTQLVLLSRAMGTLVESVHQAYDAMDSVFLGEAERQSIPLYLEGEDEPNLTIAELLAWAERFGSEEGPRLIREGGKHGVRAFRPSIDRLRELVRSAWELSQQRPQNPVKGFHTPRVQRTLEELTTYSDQIYDLASQVVGAPWVSSIQPKRGRQGKPLTVTIEGGGFKQGIVVNFGTGIGEPKVTWVDDKELKAVIKIDGEADPGRRDVIVTNPDGLSHIKKRIFEVIETWPPIKPSAAELAAETAGEAAEKVADAAEKVADAAEKTAEKVADAAERAADAAEKAAEAVEKAVSAPPVADFSGTPTDGKAPLDVHFKDRSTGRPTSWAWDFGDKGTSSDQNPSHTYTAPGVYTVILTVTYAVGSNSVTKSDYITVTGGGFRYSSPWWEKHQKT